ncbi:tRNA (N(6)-L-threonylcarbamoyladenosine(37)-C(2))-methylthiotransferase MtaB [SAR202 cluster bacterium AD-804-J14_MRT_500m]|nr:tRNA (N(6)-L-threonylcarbamoyladenosine(37)-C(2))-methylthiotransferase MtaB [SAR202 cluster bacterium AD-804-J14_MRT_500m]
MPEQSSISLTRRTVAIETHGCKLNQADSDVLLRRFLEAGFRIVGTEDGPDVYVLNSCTVTHVADAKARNALRAARRINPLTTVVATGCYVQRRFDEVKNIPGVDLVGGNFDKHRLVEQILEKFQNESPKSDPYNLATGPLNGFQRTRAMVKIQEGCNQICSYCIVPKVRGREHSIPLRSLVDQVRTCVGEGFKEVVLTGTQLGSYGYDIPGTNLINLIENLLQQTNLERLRVSSLQPQEITPELLSLWKNPRLCPHFHIPLQSGSDVVLKDMRRRYTTEIYDRRVKEIYQFLPGASVTADLIVGFPTEGKGEFEESYRFCEGLNLANIHVFPYSVRPGTTAAHVASKQNSIERRDRTKTMLSLASRKASDFRKKSFGSIHTVLWEKSDRSRDKAYIGLTDNYLRVRCVWPDNLTNKTTLARLGVEEGRAINCEVIPPKVDSG